MRTKRMYTKGAFFLQLFLIYSWLVALLPAAQTDSYYSIYMICGLLGVICLLDNYRTRPVLSGRSQALTMVFSFVFSAVVLLANYDIYTPFSMLRLFKILFPLAGGFCLGFQGFVCMMNRFPMKSERAGRTHTTACFLLTFFLIASIYLVFLFTNQYPGVVSTDSKTTIRQALGMLPLDNVMPFWHTMLVGFFLKIGLFFFHDINAAVALFHCFQILFMAACFAYAFMTLYQIKTPGALLALILFFYTLIPYNLVYSATMLKDVVFAGAALLFVTSFYRILKGLGRRAWPDFLVFLIGSVGLSLLRTNGWAVFLITTIVMFFCIRKQHPKLVKAMFLVVIVCWMMLNPVLKLLNVSGMNYSEAFAVPTQQIARVIYEDRALTEEETRLLEQIFYVDKLKEDYVPYNVDKIKFNDMKRSELYHVREDPWSYLKLYISLGLRYPGDYLKAWVDQTKGFWNGGYQYYPFTQDVEGIELGIHPLANMGFLGECFKLWVWTIYRLPIFQPFYSIGFSLWALVACMVVNGMKKRKEWLLGVPFLVIMIGLWFGTPIFAEFRYAYPLIVSMPVIFCATLLEPGESRKA